MHTQGLRSVFVQSVSGKEGLSINTDVVCMTLGVRAHSCSNALSHCSMDRIMCIHARTIRRRTSRTPVRIAIVPQPANHMQKQMSPHNLFSWALLRRAACGSHVNTSLCGCPGIQSKGIVNFLASLTTVSSQRMFPKAAQVQQRTPMTADIRYLEAASCASRSCCLSRLAKPARRLSLKSCHRSCCNLSAGVLP